MLPRTRKILDRCNAQLPLTLPPSITPPITTPFEQPISSRNEECDITLNTPTPTELSKTLSNVEPCSTQTFPLTQKDASLNSADSSSNSSEFSEYYTSSSYQPSEEAVSPCSSPVELLTDADDVTYTQEVFHGDLREGNSRKRKGDKGQWKKNYNKLLRMQGKKYLGYTNPKHERMKQNKMRPERILGVRCESNFCKRSKKRVCEQISDEDRKNLFHHFWSDLTWDQRKIFVSTNVHTTSTKRNTTENTSRRSNTLQFSLPGNDEHGNTLRRPVCRIMFLNTLCLGSFTVQSWVKKGRYGMHPSQNNANLNRKKTSRVDVEMQTRHLDNFLDALPKMPSHYNRKNTNKLFLEPLYKSQSNLYNIYKEYCSSKNTSAFSMKKFNEVFHSKNLSIHQLKKDMCDTCVAHSVGNLSEELYQQHIKNKDKARNEKMCDKERAVRNECILLTADVQAVKVSPCITASAIYFKTKLACHNFTVYDTTTHHATCYWFSEIDSDVTASTFASLLIDYLERHCLSKRLPIILFTDGCTSQNRNAILANALLNFCMHHGVTITQKFLEVGHTQMEGDAVHSAIERKLKNRNIHLPSDYLAVTKEARTRPFPYEALMIPHNFFKNYADESTWRYTTIRPGRKVGDPRVIDIKAIMYKPTGSIQVKLNFDDDWTDLPLRPRQIPVITEYKPMHNTPIPITATKFKHLQELKTVIPPDCHGFYDSLPHK
ncbi:unnamed protein product [Diabrotica balteata]|uniref:DUF7869 domain-containing protein n=1 Tax=Diabrotica balteata TaxID=107213 RepID=A0A9N9XFX3_DIABA|nr:unnamed protein product [Diabrotica balteata]